jgi:hypothetical protein
MILAVAVGAGAKVAMADLPGGVFTPGDIVVVQGGDAVNTQTNDTGTVPGYLDEYTPTGTLVGQVALPTATSGSNNPLSIINANGFEHEGLLTLSESGSLLSFAGYDGAPGTTAFSSYNGTVGTIGNSTSTLNTSTTLATGGQSVRAATTIDGNEFYVALSHGSATGGPGGLNYISGSGASATDTNLGGTLDPRSVVILGGASPSTGVLVSGSGSSSFSGFGGTGHSTYGLTGSGGGLPTATPISGSQIAADASDGSDVIFDNEPGNTHSYHGYNTMYLSGNTSATTGFVEKYTYNGTNFTIDGSTVLTTTTDDQDPVGITVQKDASTGNIDVFYTLLGGIYELNTPDNSTSGFSSTTSSLIVASPTGSDFYGIANAPVAVPEPASISLIAIGAGGLLARRRRKMV